MRPYFWIGLALSLCFPSTCLADSLILKTGEVLRGKITDKNEKSYYILLESDENKIEVPISKVSIADISSPIGKIANARSGSVIVFAKAGENIAPQTAVSEQTYKPAATDPDKKKSLFRLPGADLIEKAEKTVADANARTAAAEQRMLELKAIADAANS